MRCKTAGLLAVAFSLGVVQAASAADMPTKAPMKAPMMAPAFSSTGFYASVHAGGSWSAGDDPDYTLTDPSGGAPFTSRAFASCGSPTGVAVPVPTSPNPFDLRAACSNDSSFLGGGQIGYNWQTGSVVLGVEADVSWRELTDYSFSVFGNNPTAGLPMGSVAADTAYFKSKQGALGTLRGRIGYAPGNWLLYVTGGLAIGHVEHSVTEVLSPGHDVASRPAGGTPVRPCRTAPRKSAGRSARALEFACWQHWSIGAEYLYVDLGDTTLTINSLGAASDY